MEPNSGPVEHRGHDTSLTRENLDEITKQQTLHRFALEKEFWSDYVQEVRCVESERDKVRKKNKILRRKNKMALKRIAAYERNAVVEEGQLEAIEKIMALEKERDKALERATMAENDAEAEIWRCQKEADDMLAANKAKIAHLESQLAMIHSLSKRGETAASTSARHGDRTELASQEDTFPSSETASLFSFESSQI